MFAGADKFIVDNQAMPVAESRAKHIYIIIYYTVDSGGSYAPDIQHTLLYILLCVCGYTH